MIEMSNVTRVPFEWLMSRGQQIKVFSQLVYECSRSGYIVPVFAKLGNNDGYVGATVLNAMAGGYYEPITGLDFASLYPTIMIANNLCYTTRVPSDILSKKFEIVQTLTSAEEREKGFVYYKSKEDRRLWTLKL